MSIHSPASARPTSPLIWLHPARAPCLTLPSRTHQHISVANRIWNIKWKLHLCSYFGNRIWNIKWKLPLNVEIKALLQACGRKKISTPRRVFNIGRQILHNGTSSRNLKKGAPCPPVVVSPPRWQKKCSK